METQKPTVNDLLNEVRERRRNGGKVVSLKKLEDALTLMAVEGSHDTQWAMKEAELNHLGALEAMRSEGESGRSLLNATITLAGSALKSAILINGGAAVAVLAYLGNAKVRAPDDFRFSLLWFTLGVFLAALGSGFGYLAQHEYLLENRARGDAFRQSCIRVTIGSFAAFILGSWMCFEGFAP